MSAEEENYINSQIQHALLMRYSHISLNITDGELHGTHKNGYYIYDYIPKENTNFYGAIRFIFNEKLYPQADTEENITQKFNKIESMSLPWSKTDCDILPDEWTFVVKILDPSNLSNAIKFTLNNDSDRLQMCIYAQKLEITASKGDKKITHTDSPWTKAMIYFDLIVKNAVDLS
ncbi:unnamed protein product [Adineta steineri]|uniref:Uncharacterized protein n=1 Tax=Adineta steineri TaxID=433720 RepID=A0A820FWG7_9BILA|nr:unnamed protein product [Adineta steineri]CAF4268029.1 unnamed protein product [Adineta steineri]